MPETMNGIVEVIVAWIDETTNGLENQGGEIEMLIIAIKTMNAEDRTEVGKIGSETPEIGLLVIPEIGLMTKDQIAVAPRQEILIAVAVTDNHQLDGMNGKYLGINEKGQMIRGSDAHLQ
jgi:hypothetical protein